MKKINIEDISSKVLIYNLYLTQFIVLTLGLTLYFLIYRLSPFEVFQLLLPTNIYQDVFYAVIFALIIILVDIILTKKLPADWLDDGGINKKIFQSLPVWQIAIITLIIGFAEELLFRGLLQSTIGILGSSILFALIHFRYIKKIILFISILMISFGLGILVYYTEWFTAFIAHFLIDFGIGVLISKKKI